MTKTQKAVADARWKLRSAVDSACIARGEAQWTNGYRAARMACGAESEIEDSRLYRKELAQFEIVATAEARVDRLIAAYSLAIRRSYNPIKGRR